MSHTTKTDKTIFIHNSDLSGDVIIKNDNGSLKVNGNDLINFSLNHLKNKKIRIAI